MGKGVGAGVTAGVIAGEGLMDASGAMSASADACTVSADRAALILAPAEANGPLQEDVNIIAAASTATGTAILFIRTPPRLHKLPSFYTLSLLKIQEKKQLHQGTADLCSFSLLQ